MKHTLALTTLFLLAWCEAPQPVEPSESAATGLFEGIATGLTRVVDLTHPLNSQNPHWPGPGYEPFKYEPFATIEKDGVLSGRFTMAEHTGTHLDAPNHFVTGQISVDKLPPEALLVPLVVIDVRPKVSGNPDYVLTPDDVPRNSGVMMHTGWDERWADFDKYKNADKDGALHFPGFAAEAARLLVEDRDVAGIGIDTLSVDYGMSKDFAVHHISHGKGKYHLENVANLGNIPAAGAFVIVAPINIEDGTGGPARIFALIRNLRQ